MVLARGPPNKRREPKHVYLKGVTKFQCPVQFIITVFIVLIFVQIIILSARTAEADVKELKAVEYRNTGSGLTGLNLDT